MAGSAPGHDDTDPSSSPGLTRWLFF